jgi:hypothetical protein
MAPLRQSASDVLDSLAVSTQKLADEANPTAIAVVQVLRRRGVPIGACRH